MQPEAQNICNNVMNEVWLRGLLLSSSSLAQASSQMHILLPERLVQHALIPHGHLTEIAHKCNVRIDVGPEVLPIHRAIHLIGTVISNTFAAYCLQECVLRAGVRDT